ncbi:Fe3+-citrate ABC transporter substrate-binding protein [Mycolicibacterium madagascariense]|uniref:Fe3+-citrate ABC transporter substrate-binding protein n=1 Tax=Mycolicibacterium madagascariense TaxID=212765 RepID=A0A7I7XEX3_9MYCO|nr:iron-siderophore ABC transporter substrate-binding protein [Mycolicibacterium madagascariense]MCV7015441.1 iron-siderophore ABC transporter substrate-binding protein [Mycolicibacterium madagascariense]BBZ27739.1 Fe3+-citrate ABC transporter substrate-binding protein [Mycolicibacterium madagascariense]
MGAIAAGVAIVTALVITLVSGCGDDGGSAPANPDAASAVVTSTTAIAGAGVLGNDRRPDDSCAPNPAPVDDGPPTREVRHAAGTTEVPADPQRIVVLSGDQLDALCALGLQSRIVAAALADGSSSQPSYLGSVIHAVPPAGTRSTPDVGAIKAANPDLILGSEALTPEAYGELSGIAPTVFTGPPGPGWQDTLRTVGAATGRNDAATALLAGFQQAAAKTGADDDATHYQVSVVQLTQNTLRVYGTDDFPASVLSAIGADRPIAQRFKDKPYQEISTSQVTKSTDFSAADGDIVYLTFDSPAAKERADAVLESDAWRKLSATKDNRVFIVNDEVWQTGQGLVAARGMLADLRFVNAPIN